uniref:Uncharacterized protein n=1 Tax=Cannabis sativa TaxID=3483 RepID=A0A803NJH8_CANSA
MSKQERAQLDTIDKFLSRRFDTEVVDVRKQATVLSTRKGVEFADLAKSPNPLLPIFDCPAIVERFQPRVGSDLAPFVADVSDQTATTFSRLGFKRCATVASGDPAFISDCLKHQTFGTNLLVERYSTLVNKLTLEVQNHQELQKKAKEFEAGALKKLKDLEVDFYVKLAKVEPAL